RVLSISKCNCSAMLTKEFLSAECSQPHPTSKGILGAAMTVYPRPPTRSRASSAIVERPESFSALVAPRPAAPAPMMATSTSEGRDMPSVLARSLLGLKPTQLMVSSSAKADDPVRRAVLVYLRPGDCWMPRLRGA